jgi:hypothetical protein
MTSHFTFFCVGINVPVTVSQELYQTTPGSHKTNFHRTYTLEYDLLNSTGGRLDRFWVPLGGELKAHALSQELISLKQIC